MTKQAKEIENQKSEELDTSITKLSNKKKNTKKALIDEVERMICTSRHETHGSSRAQFSCAQELKTTLIKYNGGLLNSSGRESAEMICTKLSRIATGKNIKDHWLDIAGYAILAAKEAEEK